MANLAFVWEKYEQNVIAYEKEWYMLCYGYKWAGGKTHVVSLPDFKSYKTDKTNDKELIKSLWNLFNEADVIVGHNSNSFDIKKTNARFLYYGLPPTSPYKMVDTKVMTKSRFKFNSNKLDDLGTHLGLGQKVKTGGFDLWLGCASGDKKSWSKMIKYNRQDVDLLEKVYNKLVPWCKHPIVYTGEICCRVCGHKELQHRGWSYMDSGKSKRPKYSCKKCGRWSLGELVKVN
jgi:DNA polymerase elongation subunit (family B)